MYLILFNFPSNPIKYTLLEYNYMRKNVPTAILEAWKMSVQKKPDPQTE